MKIALVTETYPPEINGVAMTLSQLVNALRDRGHHVQVVRPTQDGAPSETPNELTVYGLPIPRYPQMRFGLPCGNRLLKAWKLFKPDIVHVATEGPLGFSAINVARKLGLPITSTFHTNFHSYSEHYDAPWMSGIILGYLRWFHNRASCNMSPTQELCEELESHGFQNNEVLGRGVKLDVFNPFLRCETLRSSWGIQNGELSIIHVSRLGAEKNYDLLARAYDKIRNEKPDTKFIIVGEGPEYDTLQERLPYAIFTGAIPLEDRQELGRHYASADIFLYPSLTETFGNVLTEALASGLAVVAYDYAAAGKYLKNGDNGLSIPLESEESKFISASLQVAQDPNLRSTLQTGARNTAHKLDWTPVIDTFETLLKRHANQ
ncbi:MAG: glycosyltransferase family 1 protein [Verrucomicrobiota bacterium]